MISKSKPVLGVCHGCFLLVDALGGVISQKSGHRDTEHFVSYDDKKILVNSYHDTYIKNTHDSALCLARDEEGDCEAWVDGKLAGVAWHPERMQDPWLPKEIEKLTGLHL